VSSARESALRADRRTLPAWTLPPVATRHASTPDDRKGP